MVKKDDSGKNVMLFGSKVQACIFGLKIFEFMAKMDTSNMQHCVSNIQRCQF